MNFAADVEAILDQYGKVDDRDGWVTLGRVKVDHKKETSTFERIERTPEYEARPTRTQIIEEAVRLWLADKQARAMLEGYTPEQWAEIEAAEADRMAMESIEASIEFDANIKEDESLREVGVDPAKPGSERTVEAIKNDPLTDTLWEQMMNAPVRFGLVAQGHIPTIERMLSEGRDWKEISSVIGWEENTAREHYGWYLEAKKKNELNSHV